MLIDDVGFGASVRLWRAMPHAYRRAAGSERAQIQPLPHHRPVLADPPGAADRDATTTRSAWAASPKWPPRRPANNSIRPKSCAPLAETLKLNGYATAQFGKCHEVPVLGDQPVRARTTTGPALAVALSISTASSGGETNQYYPARCTKAPRRSSRIDPRRGLSPHRRHGQPRHPTGCAGRRR